jgi:hypothetical protein
VCAINKLNGNHKVPKEEKSKLSKYKNRLWPLVNPKFGFKNKRKIYFRQKNRYVGESNENRKVPQKFETTVYYPVSWQQLYS